MFQGHLGFPIQATMADRGLEAFREGDVFMHNDPYAGNGNHLNDVAMYAPVFWEGRLTGFVSVKAHWSDVGGPVPSSHADRLPRVPPGGAPLPVGARCSTGAS